MFVVSVRERILEGGAMATARTPEIGEPARLRSQSLHLIFQLRQSADLDVTTNSRNMFTVAMARQTL